MSGIFPNENDGAVSCDIATPPGYCPVTPPLTPALYYGSGCDARLRPEVLNSLISEVAAVVDEGAVAYSPSRRENMELAIRYLIQRGIPHAGQLKDGPNNYTMALDPPLTGYTNHLTLVIVPNVDNALGVTLNVDGKGATPVLRSDGYPLQPYDWKKDRPALVSYWNGNFYMVGLVGSQVPLVLTQTIDLWVRPDGNDVTGDGTANTPNKAFRTINRAFQSFASRYAASPAFAINIRLGVPGDYESCQLYNCANTVNVIGDVNNYAAYRLRTTAVTPPLPDWTSCVITDGLKVVFYGVTFVLDQSQLQAYGIVTGTATSLTLQDCRFEFPLSHPQHFGLWIGGGCVFAGHLDFVGYGTTVGGWLIIHQGKCNAFEAYSPASRLNIFRWYNLNFTIAGLWASSAGSAVLDSNDSAYSGCTGPKFLCEMNGTAWTWRDVPGNQPGIIRTGGQAQIAIMGP